MRARPPASLIEGMKMETEPESITQTRVRMYQEYMDAFKKSKEESAKGPEVESAKEPEAESGKEPD